MPRNISTNRSVREAFKLANVYVPADFVVEVAYDRKSVSWHAFIVNDRNTASVSFYGGVGIDPVAAVVALAENNGWSQSANEG